MIKLASALILLTASLLPISAVNAAQMPSLKLSHAQSIVIVKAYRLGGLVFAGIILQESSACTASADGVYGCGQLLSSTADGIVGWHVDPEDLRKEQDLNLEISYAVLRGCAAQFGWLGGITCYYYGPTATAAMSVYHREHSDYLQLIQRRMRELGTLPISED